MTGSSRRDESARHDGHEPPTQQAPYGQPGHADPAYANQAPYDPSRQLPYQAPVPPTEQFPAYSPYGQQPPPNAPYTGPYGTQYVQGGPPEPPEPEKPGRALWLWALAALSVVIVIGLVIALVVVNGSQSQTVVAPPNSPPEPTLRTAPSTSSRAPTTTRTPIPLPPTATTSPGQTTSPGAPAPGGTETVVYDVEGEGRAINITYIDTGGVFQTEFNVMLPWRKEVSLAAPAKGSASVSIINVGRDITCSISVDDTLVQQRTGSGLTVCSPI